MKTDSPLISVILPVYNAEKYVELAIFSILGQTYTNFELVIIDDGSTDDSKKIITRMANSDNRIRLISRPNKGLIKTLNEAIDVSRGDYIARMDADDICLPDRLENQITFLSEHPGNVVVGTLSTLIDSDGDEIGPFGKWVKHDEIDSAHLSGHGGAIIHPSVMIRTDALRCVGGYREEFKSAEDIDLWLRLAELGKVTNIDKRLILYRQHMDSIGHRHRSEQVTNTRKAILDAYKRRRLQPDEGAQLFSSSSDVSDSELDTMLKWGWWALGAKNIKTAKKYAFKSLFMAPLTFQSWKLLVCSYRGY
ncbi:glycosyltransferase family 2 protein [Methylophaga thalassica]|uniref:glycosyltransferase family 2 protein n=1 Tax=Methylophaga aminisulfidivorans TaxID=230105 RepID=UPI0024E1B80B|nr:glycosyltransferase [Methylophaga aminisulfidivorans]